MTDAAERPLINRIASPLLDAKSGDVWLFSRQGFFNKVIQIKTWSRFSHVEVADVTPDMDVRTIASRNGDGCGIYEPDLNGLALVLRPTVPFDRVPALLWWESEAVGQPYDIGGLFGFFYPRKLSKAPRKSMFCSTAATRYLRRGGFDPFPENDADQISPRDFSICPLIAIVWRNDDEWQRWHKAQDIKGDLS